MKRTLLLTTTLLLWCTLHAQDLSQTIVADPGNFLCQPGVLHKSPGKGLSLEYTTLPSFRVRPSNRDFGENVRRNERFNFKIKIPCINHHGFKVLGGLQYQLERYHFSEADELELPLFHRLNSADLKTARAALYVSKSLNHKFYTSFRLGATWSGDYDGALSFQNRYATYRVAGVFGIKRNESLEYGFGALFSKSFRRTTLLPFGFYNRTFNHKWGIETAIPVKFMLRHNISPRNLVLLGGEYSSRSYSIDVAETPRLPSIFHYRRAYLLFSATFQQQLTAWTWLELKAGFADHLPARVRNTALNETTRVEQGNSPYFQLGFFLSPPKNACKPRK
ncbi:MAG: hypothetical protein D6765_09265 [Bacteroidetes bacterium]|nr:MAG: hypothetical protein D6765_09265 [Bacteroidota bacterium]